MPGTPTSVRVTAFNAGGESLPSETLTVLRAATDATNHCRERRAKPDARERRDTLIVTGYTSLDPEMNPPYSAPSGFGSALAPGGTAQRVRPAEVNARNYSIQAGRALAANSRTFDCASVSAVGGGPSILTTMRQWCGSQAAAAGGRNRHNAVAVAPARVPAQGGQPVPFGARVAEELDRPTTAPVPSKSDRRFLREVLHAEYLTTASREQLAVSGVEVDDGTAEAYSPVPVDWVKPARDAATSTALTVRDDGSWIVVAPRTGTRRGERVVFCTVPFETITGEATRAALMRDILGFFDGANPGTPGKREAKRNR